MIKRILIFGLLLAFFSMPVFAQGPVRVDAAGNVDITMPPAVRVGYSNWYDIYNYGVTSHRLTYRPVGAPASFTLTLECSNTGSDSASSVLGTGSTVTGGAITASSTACTRVRWHLSALSGTVTLYLTYHGSFDAAGAAATVAISQSGSDNNVAFGTPQHVIVDSGGGGGTQYTNDVALTIASTIGTMALCRGSTAAPTNVSNTDDATLLWCLLNGSLVTQPAIAGNLGVGGNGAVTAGTPRVTLANDGTGILASVGSIGAIVCGTGATNLCKAEDAVAASGDTAVPIMGVIQASLTSPAADGDYTVLKLNANGAAWTQNVFQTAADAAIGAALATNPVPIACHNETSPTTIGNTQAGVPECDTKQNLMIVGSVAHDGVDSGAPLKIGYRAVTSVSGQTMVVANDRTDGFAGVDGVPIFREHANLEDRVSTTPVTVTDGSSTSLVAAQGSGIRFCATTLTVSNSSATNVTVDIRDGTAGAVLWTVPAAANMGGAVVEFAVPLCTTANTAMAVDPSASASSIVTSVIGFKTKL